MKLPFIINTNDLEKKNETLRSLPDGSLDISSCSKTASAVRWILISSEQIDFNIFFELNDDLLEAHSMSIDPENNGLIAFLVFKKSIRRFQFSKHLMIDSPNPASFDFIPHANSLFLQKMKKFTSSMNIPLNSFTRNSFKSDDKDKTDFDVLKALFDSDLSPNEIYEKNNSLCNRFPVYFFLKTLSKLNIPVGTPSAATVDDIPAATLAIIGDIPADNVDTDLNDSKKRNKKK